jgi:hypothetical protein
MGDSRIETAARGYLSDASYGRFLDARVRSIDEPLARDHVKARFERWRGQYCAHRLTERMAELLSAEKERPNLLYLRDKGDLELLRILAGRHRFDARVFRGFLVEDLLWDQVRPEWFLPFPVCRVSDWDDREDSVVFTLSEDRPLRKGCQDRGNDFLDRFIDLRRFQAFVPLRDRFQESATVVLYVDYKKVHTLAAIAEQVGRHPSGQWKTMVLLDDPDVRMTGYDAVICEPFYYLWPLVFQMVQPDLFHINVGWGTQGMPFVPFVRDKGRAVIDFYDVVTFMSDEALIEGRHREPPSLTRSSERFLFRHFRNIMHRCADAINPRLKQHYGSDANLLSMFEYLRDPVCSSPVSESQTIRVVYGGEVTNSSSPEDPVYQWTVGMMECFARENVHLYLYPNPSITRGGRSQVIDDLIQKLQLPNVHSCASLAEDDYIRAISKYDYGIIAGPTPPAIRPFPYGYGPPFKFIAYLKAGLPVVVPEDFTMIADLVRRYGIGVVYTYDDLDGMPELLAAQDLRQLKVNVLRHRELFRIEKGAPRVLRMYAGMLGTVPQSMGASSTNRQCPRFSYAR